MGVARARLSMPGTDEWLLAEVNKRRRPNGTLRFNPDKDHHYNMYGHYVEQFAATTVVSELLLQSVGDVIRVFPAWPKDKPARFETLRAQGGFSVSAELKQGEVTRVEIRSTVGGPCRVLNPWPGEKGECRKGNETLSVKPDERGIITIETKPNDRLVLGKVGL